MRSIAESSSPPGCSAAQEARGTAIARISFRMSRIYLVVAVAANGIIGAKGKLPWHLPEDLKHFKRLTLGHPVIIGRRTRESLPCALPSLANIVVTRQARYHAPSAAVARSPEAARA